MLIAALLNRLTMGAEELEGAVQACGEVLRSRSALVRL